jgi:hypothetical protein
VPSAIAVRKPPCSSFFHILCQGEISRGGGHGEFCPLVRDALMFGEIYLSVKGRANNIRSDHVREDSIPRNHYANTPRRMRQEMFPKR